jgi:hypothetical protein
MPGVYSSRNGREVWEDITAAISFTDSKISIKEDAKHRCIALLYN